MIASDILMKLFVAKIYKKKETRNARKLVLSLSSRDSCCFFKALNVLQRTP